MDMNLNRAGGWKVSVIVPVYRVEKYIDRCMKSLLKQTLKEIEIICVCEKEDSAYGKLCAYARADDRVHVIEKKNTGVSAARNAGIMAARGTYLAFVDADDWIERYALQELYAAAEKYRAQIVVFGIWPTMEPGEDKRGMFGCSPKRNVLYHNNGMKALFYEHGSRPYIGNKFYNRVFLNMHNILFEESVDIGEDQLLQFDAFGKAETICFIRNKLYHYDIGRNDSAMNQCELKQLIEDRNFKLLQTAMNQKKRQYGNQYNKEYLFWILQQYGWIIYENPERMTENRKKEIIAIQHYLCEISAKDFSGSMPTEYQHLYDRFADYPDIPNGSRQIPIMHKVDDQYMAEQVTGVYQTIAVTTGLKAVLRRIYEAVVFHELRHLIVRVLVRLGLFHKMHKRSHFILAMLCNILFL